MSVAVLKAGMSLPHRDDDLYAALLARDPAYDGLWYVGVATTGIFCRLTCPARKPRRENTSFFDSAAAAEAAGYRACLRCRPLAPTGGSDIVARLRALVAADPDRRWSEAAVAALGYDSGTVRRAFQRDYGQSFVQFARAQRLGQAVARLADGAPVIEAQLDAGYESGSGFREAIGRLLGQAPARVQGLFALQARWIETPIGAMLAVADHDALHLLEFVERRGLPRELERLQARRGAIHFGDNPVLAQTATAIARYFGGDGADLIVPLAPAGSAFERGVWTALRNIPVGTTQTYGGLAARLGRPAAVRAVARANGANTVAIIIPCHRVIGSDGTMVGYGGKIWRKQWLLEHERRMMATTRRTHVA